MINFEFEEEVEDWTSLKQLQQAAEKEEIDINIPTWRRIIRETKQEIQKAIWLNRRQKKIYVYNKNGVLQEIFKSTREAAEFYGIPQEVVNAYASQNKLYKKLNLFFRRTPLAENTNEQNIYVYQVQYKLLGVYPSAVQAAKQFNTTNYKISKSIAKGIPTDNGRVYSKTPLV